MNSYAFTPATFDSRESAIWSSFPDDLRSFLERSNGGLVDPEQSAFDVPLERDVGGARSVGAENAVEEFWAFVSYSRDTARAEGPASILHEHFDRHVKEGFLPRGVYAIARCVQNSLVCISTNPADHGVIYYWEWYWRYPWYVRFFEERVERAASRIEGANEIAENPQHPRYPELIDALNYATLVRVSSSFSEFVSALREPRA